MGTEISIIDKINRISQTLVDHGLETIILVGQLELDRRSRASLSLDRVKSIHYVDMLDRDAEELSFHRGSAYDPLWVLFSSGTSESEVVQPGQLRQTQDETTSSQPGSQKPSFTLNVD
jgi:acetoacetyl-CoA synthetase